MRWPYLLATALYCAIIFFLSGRPIQIKEEIDLPGSDKVVHACVYGGLALLVGRGMRRSGRPYGPRALYWGPVLFCLAYGITDEFHQRFVPAREFDPLDVLADAAGAALAAAAHARLDAARLGMRRPGC